MERQLKFTLNGKPVSLKVDDRRLLLWVLRTDLGLTGTKYGCGEALCGACTVLLNGEAVRSCQLSMREVEGQQITTIEGLASNGKLHPLQEAFIEHDAMQCGYCTPGMILTAYSFLRQTPQPTPMQILSAMDGTLCRCGAHVRIVKAIQTAAERMKGGA